MEERWKQFTSTGRKLTRLLSAAFQYRKASPVAPELNQSPASNAGPAYTEIGKAEAIAELCLPTGDMNLDNLHVILIDLIQKGFIQAVRITEDPHLRFIATEAGKQFVEDKFGEAVDTLLERIFNDNGHP